MRYATLAVLSLLLLGMFGMSAPVVAEDHAARVTVTVTGPSTVHATDNPVVVTGLTDQTGSYFYWIRITVAGTVKHNLRYLGSGTSITKNVPTTGWGLSSGQSFDTMITIGTANNTLSTTVVP